MKTKLLALLTAASLLAFPAMADTPNRVTQSFKQFVEASGCVIVDKGGYSNLAAADGGNCPFSVTQAFVGNYSVLVDPDGVPNSGDEYTKSDN